MNFLNDDIYKKMYILEYISKALNILFEFGVTNICKLVIAILYKYIICLY